MNQALSGCKPAAIILAAGFSSRMGLLKPLLVANGKTFLAHAAQTFLDAGISTILVVTGHQAPLVEAEARRLGLLYRRNTHYAEGMYTSICTGIEALASISPEVPGVFLLPVDIPFVAPDTIRCLWQHAVRLPGNVLVPCKSGMSGHPPYLPRTQFASILSWRGPDGLQGLLASGVVPVAAIEVSDAAILQDYDNPEDLQFLPANKSDLP
ncbi:MAG: nucleotidyltransferase family protein [Rectinemataceae bacterium]|nr:nucleotidyltransferase family protein [Spirochaetaceae bacterium]